MRKLIFLILLTIPFISFASGEIIFSGQNNNEIDYNLDINSEIEKGFNDSVSINTPYKFDLSNLENSLNILYPESNFLFNWSLKGANIQTGVIFERTFKEKGEKFLELNIIQEKNLQEKVIYTKTFKILIFERSFFLVYSDEINKNDLKNYIEYSKKDGLYIYPIGPLNKTDIELNSILTKIDEYQKSGGLKSDFMAIWGSRDFIFNILSKISGEIYNSSNNKFKLNIISISNYNLNILNNYLQNFLANKNWIKTMILINEDSKYLILKKNTINDTIKELNENKYNYIDINLKDNKLNNFFFISKFINNLSNVGYTTNSIYIFLIIPIILTVIVSFKHFIGLSPIGITIPLFITLLFFKLGFYFGLALIILYILLNLILSLIISRSNLLYAPKMTFLLTINIITFIIFINIGYDLKLINLNISDILYFIVFILLSEKIINIIISKDLLEYKEPFFYTLLVSIFCFTILNINAIKIFLIAYPEFILALIPINFLIGKFSGLRVTEYFRFKEIIKSVEE